MAKTTSIQADAQQLPICLASIWSLLLACRTLRMLTGTGPLATSIGGMRHQLNCHAGLLHLSVPKTLRVYLLIPSTSPQPFSIVSALCSSPIHPCLKRADDAISLPESPFSRHHIQQQPSNTHPELPVCPLLRVFRAKRYHVTRLSSLMPLRTSQLTPLSGEFRTGIDSGRAVGGFRVILRTIGGNRAA